MKGGVFFPSPLRFCYPLIVTSSGYQELFHSAVTQTDCKTGCLPAASSAVLRLSKAAFSHTFSFCDAYVSPGIYIVSSCSFVRPGL